MRKPETFSFIGRARHFDYYELSDSDVFRCPCGWSGTFWECAIGSFRDLTDATCQKCDTMLAIRLDPTITETRQAAAAGDARAIRALPGVEKAEVRRTRAKSLELTSDGPLPDLGVGPIDFTWDLEAADDEHWTLIRVGDRVIWRELVYWEGYPRFYQVRTILRDRYGSAFASLTPTDASWMYLFGDDISACNAYLRENPQPAFDSSSGTTAGSS